MKKPKEIILSSYGSNVSFKIDSKMSNIWIGERVPVTLENAKKLKKWLHDYIKWQESK